MSCPSTRLFTMTVLIGVTTPNALMYVPMSPFCAADVAIIRGGGAEAPFVRADCGCERFCKRRIPATARMITIVTTTQTQWRRFLAGSGLEGMVKDSADGTGSAVEPVFLLHPVVCSSVIKARLANRRLASRDFGTTLMELVLLCRWRL